MPQKKKKRTLPGLTYRVVHCLLPGWLVFERCSKRSVCAGRGWLSFKVDSPFSLRPVLAIPLSSLVVAPPFPFPPCNSSNSHLLSPSSFSLFIPISCWPLGPADFNSYHSGFSNGCFFRKPGSWKENALVLRLLSLLWIFKLIWKLKNWDSFFLFFFF